VITDSNGCGSSSGSVFTGIETHDGWSGEISVIPNPADDIVYFIFNTSQTESSTLTVFNSIGQMILIREAQPGSSSGVKFSLPVSGFSEGIYLVRIDTAKRSGTCKFVVRH